MTDVNTPQDNFILPAPLVGLPISQDRPGTKATQFKTISSWPTTLDWEPVSWWACLDLKRIWACK